MKILIVDGHAYAYRAFYAIRELRSPGGKPTNAVYGFIKMLDKMRAAVKPTHMIVVWDGGLSADRQSLLAGYKAQRPSMPEELRVQLDEIVRYLKAANLASFCQDGVEADDYIAFVAESAVKAGMRVVIASADKDFMQLVGPDVGLLNPGDKSEKIWTSEDVRAKTGVEPRQVVDWLSLVGDAVDNIPGVCGVGPKTAAALLVQFGNVRDMFERLREVKSERLRVALETAKADVERNQTLVRLKPEVGKDFFGEDLMVQPSDAGRLMELYGEWGFRSMFAELQAAQTRQQELI